MPSKKRPAIQWYTGDWLKDPNLGQCSPATRGIWADLLCLMHENGETGELVGTVESLARVCRCTAREMRAALDELAVTKTGHVTDGHKNVTVRNRRMYRECHERLNARNRKRKQRGLPESHAPVPPDVTEMSHPLSSSSTSVKEKDPPCSPPKSNGFDLPEWVPLDAWNGWLEMRRKKRAPATQRAMELAVKELDKLRVGGHSPRAVLETSTMRGWTGLFPTKDDGGRSNGQREDDLLKGAL